MAIVLHDHTCHFNHIDGCGWEYHDVYDEKVWKSSHSHVEYLRKAHDLIKTLDYWVTPEVNKVAMIKAILESIK